MMRNRRLFVAGATGETGQVLVPLAETFGLDVVPHARPSSAHKQTDARTVVFELADHARLVESLKECSTVVQLIGTMRKRFSRGDTYESSDIGTTRQLVNAAKEAGVDHFILLTSVGAGNPMGAYLQAKAKAEALVRDSGIPYTLFRPSALEGGERKPIPFAKALTRALGLVRYEPISLTELSQAMLHCAKLRAPLNVALEGASLWQEVKNAQIG